MTTVEMILAGAAGGSILGYFLHGAKKWFTQEADVKTLTGSHKHLKEDFIAHKDDRRIHLDPDRDPAALRELKTTLLDRFDSADTRVDSRFDSVDLRLDKIDKRCEARGDKCSEHFTKLEKKIAVSTGRANGD